MAYVLIVDDDEIIASVASEALIGSGHACGWVTSAEDALALLKWRRPDLVLLDQDMPGMTGQELMRQLRSSENFYDLPIIMFTAMTGVRDEERALYHGAQGYIRKPFHVEHLVAMVEGVLKARENRPSHMELREVLAQKRGKLRQPQIMKRAV